MRSPPTPERAAPAAPPPYRRPQRTPCLAPLAALALVCQLRPALAAESVSALIERSPLAGSQYHALAAVADAMRPGDKLLLVRERDNRHDANAIRVEWQGRLLGYVPRRDNRALAAAMDRGERLEARVAAVRESSAPWRRVEFEVHLVL